jgi:hypothetical protein
MFGVCVLYCLYVINFLLVRMYRVQYIIGIQDRRLVKGLCEMKPMYLQCIKIYCMRALFADVVVRSENTPPKRKVYSALHICLLQ